MAMASMAPAENGNVERDRRRRRKKNNKSAAAALVKPDPDSNGVGAGLGFGAANGNVQVEYVVEKPAFEDESDPLAQNFKQIFEKFTSLASSDRDARTGGDDPRKKVEDKDADDDGDEQEDAKPAMSNKKKKLQTRMTVGELKQLCNKPEVVEVWDANATDPRLLVHLKAYRNTVEVPRHWCQKRKFLQGKRGIEKSQFHLPEFIAATGIEKIRQAYVDKEDSKKLKQKQREKMQPKMGKMDIDYQVLHDAFFKFQTKPKLTGVGDLYYEGKEYESKRTKDMRPGYLSAELRNALGMPEGAPPPWLINMQRFGPPPSYPKLVIPGLNAPIPQGASFGYHPGGWGKPPVDDFGRPLYGDVFGVARAEPVVYEEEQVDKTYHWGDLEEQEEEEEEEEEQEAEEEAMEEVAMEDGAASVDVDAMSSAGMETPDVIDLRKQPLVKKDAGVTELFTVLPEKEESATAGATLLGTTHTYMLPGSTIGKKVEVMKGQKADKINVTIRPEELETGLDEKALAAKFQEVKDEKNRAVNPSGEDFRDLVNDNEKKRKRKAEKDAKSKMFKF